MLTLDIIIVNWNAGTLLRDCLESVVASSLMTINLQRVVVVDNASTDNSLNELEDLPLPLHIIQNKTNLGFGQACNIGAENSQADYILLLNPDTQLHQDTLTEAVQFIETSEHQSIGILGVQLVDESGNITRSCRYFPTPLRIFSRILGLNRFIKYPAFTTIMPHKAHQSSQRVDQVMGAFFLTRRALYDSLGGMDEQFFVYYEEVDYARRAYEAGYTSYYLATTQAYHQGWGTTDQVKARRLAYNLYSRIQYSYKHFHWLSATGLLLATLLIEPFYRTVISLLREPSSVGQTWQAYGLLWKRLLTSK